MNISDKITKEKEKENKRKNNKLRRWYRKNRYKIWRIILFPFWIYDILETKHRNNNYKKMRFSNEVCKEYLDKVMPFMILNYCEDTDRFFISNYHEAGDINIFDFFDTNINKKYKKISRYFGKFNGYLFDYILNEYEIDGYKKITMRNWTDWSAVKVQFNLKGFYLPNHSEGVLFYIDKEDE